MIFFPPAKINLGLRVLFKRPDGYHEIDTCMVQIPYFDILEILPAKEFTFLQTGLEIPGDSNLNLCVQAYHLMKAEFDIDPVYLHLRKEIPTGAGLGGGSSDAAFVMRGIRNLFQVECSDEKLEEMVAELGSDCSFFIQDYPRIARGRGEKLFDCSVDLKGKYLKIVNPGIHVSTKEAYQNIKLPVNPVAVKEVVKSPLNQWKYNLINDFEVSVFQMYPVLESIINKLYAEGAVYAAMAGSGSTLFGIFEYKPERTFENEKSFTEKIMQF